MTCRIKNIDAVEGMSELAGKSVDMIFVDPPYGKTALKWDNVIPFDRLWPQFNRIIKDNGAIAITCRQPFTSALIMSNLKMFRQTWVWDKVIATNFMNARKMHTQGFEDVAVFYKEPPTYNPQMEPGEPYKDGRSTSHRTSTEALCSRAKYVAQDNKGERFPRGIVRISARNNSPVHPTQKPVELCEYFIRTYTNVGDTVLDCCMGSGSIGVAALNLGRSFIGFEIDEGYFKTAEGRLKAAGAETETAPVT